MEFFKISVVEETNKISSIFIKANDFIMAKHSDKFLQTSNNLKIKLLTELWNSEYHAILLFKNQTPTDITFNRKTDMTMFLLKWS
jgi:hypothetical protein